MKPLINSDQPISWSNPYGYWPKGMHWELLKAIYLEDNVEALHNWGLHCNIDTADTGMLRLLPLLYRRLNKDKRPHPALTLLKSKYRYTVYRNHLFIHRLQGVIQKLEQANIPYLFIKGLGMMVEFYRDMGLRPMNDWDISVPFDDYENAAEIIRDCGFKPQIKATHSYRHLRASQGWEDPDGFEIDLHWRVLPGYIKHDLPSVWENRKNLTFKNIHASVPPAEVTFLLTLLHGLRPNTVAPIRWIPDCIEILDNTQDTFDWDYCLSLTQDNAFHFEFKTALHFIRSLRPDLKVPAHTYHTVPIKSAQATFTPIDATQGFWPLLKHSFHIYSQTAKKEHILNKARHLPHCLRYHLSLEDDESLPQALVTRIKQRIR